MKPKLKLFQAWMFCAVGMGIGPSFSLVPQCAQCGTAASAEAAPAETCIPWSKIGVPECGTGADCQGDGLAVSPTADGARLRCAFQLLEGEATREGLWLTSTVIPPGGAGNERFRIVAAAVGRQSTTVGTRSTASPLFQTTSGRPWKAPLPVAIATTGTVAVDGQTVRFTRPGLVEEYSVSMDGVRQDFVVLEPPRSCAQKRGELAVWLAVSGAQMEAAAFGTRLVLVPQCGAGRKIAYSRLRVTDATGKELTARMEVLPVGDEVTIGVRPSSGAAGCSSSAGWGSSSPFPAPDVAAPEDGRTPTLAVLVMMRTPCIPCALTRLSAMPTGSA